MSTLENGSLEGEINMDSIYRQYALPLKKFVFSMCNDSDLSDDIVSETFYKAIKYIDSFRGGNFFSWLCTIAKNTYFNHRKKKETSNISLEDQEFTEPASKDKVEDIVLQKERNIQLYKDMQVLEEKERELIYLRIFADLSFKEIGEILGKSENWARVTFFRCKEKLKRSMTNE